MKNSAAGTDEKNDVMVELTPLNKGDGVRIEVISQVKKQFGRQIEESVREVLQERNIDDIQVIIKDKKALDFTIRARLEAAIDRAGGEKE